MPSPLLRLLATAAAAVVLIPATAHAADVAAVGAQQKLTRIGPDGNLAFSAHDPAIAYNSADDEFLLAWLGRDPAAPGETEVYGQILDATGKPKGTVRRLSTVAGTPEQPVVSYSSAVNTYILAYVAPPPAGPNNPAGQEEIIGSDRDGDRRAVRRAGADLRHRSVQRRRRPGLRPRRRLRPGARPVPVRVARGRRPSRATSRSRRAA